jgi:hypothetical protein
LIGFALTDVMVSKHEVKVTTGNAGTFIRIVLDKAGFPVGQGILEFRKQRI